MPAGNLCHILEDKVAVIGGEIVRMAANTGLNISLGNDTFQVNMAPRCCISPICINHGLNATSYIAGLIPLMKPN